METINGWRISTRPDRSVVAVDPGGATSVVVPPSDGDVDWLEVVSVGGWQAPVPLAVLRRLLGAHPDRIDEGVTKYAAAAAAPPPVGGEVERLAQEWEAEAALADPGGAMQQANREYVAELCRRAARDVRRIARTVSIAMGVEDGLTPPKPPTTPRTGRLRGALSTLGTWRMRDDGADGESLNLILDELPAVLDELEAKRARVAHLENVARELHRTRANLAAASERRQPTPDSSPIIVSTLPESPSAMLARLGARPDAWAREFMVWFGAHLDSIDEGVMISWFANAIGAAQANLAATEAALATSMRLLDALESTVPDAECQPDELEARARVRAATERRAGADVEVSIAMGVEDGLTPPKPPTTPRTGRLRGALSTLGTWRMRDDGADGESLNLILDELPAVLDELEAKRARVAHLENVARELHRTRANLAAASERRQPTPDSSPIIVSTLPESPSAMLARLGARPDAWAREFMVWFGAHLDSIDEGVMISWFANAIGAAQANLAATEAALATSMRLLDALESTVPDAECQPDELEARARVRAATERRAGADVEVRPLHEIADYLAGCAATWDPTHRLVGNLQAHELMRLAMFASSALIERRHRAGEPTLPGSLSHGVAYAAAALPDGAPGLGERPTNEDLGGRLYAAVTGDTQHRRLRTGEWRRWVAAVAPLGDQLRQADERLRAAAWLRTVALRILAIWGMGDVGSDDASRVEAALVLERDRLRAAVSAAPGELERTAAEISVTLGLRPMKGTPSTNEDLRR